MAPRIRITKEDIINASVELVRRDGEDALNTRAIASYLGCSTQPIFSNFSSMEDLKLSMVKKADEFAKEEPELFKLLYMRDRTSESTLDEDEAATDEVLKNVMENTGLDKDSAMLFHLEIWAFVHGIAAMLATGFLDLDRDLISRMITDTYQGLKHRFGKD